MATELIATGTGAASSSDITVADGATATVFLKDADGGSMTYHCLVYIEIKDSGGVYNTIGVMTEDFANGKSARVINGKGTYRVRRDAESASCGVGQG